MITEELIEGLKKVKEWDPRAFIVETIDAATAYIQAHPDAPVVADKVIGETETKLVDAPAAADAVAGDAPKGKAK